MQMIRRVIDGGEGVVIGCSSCGEVESLYGNATHKCLGSSDPTAVTISALRVSKTSVGLEESPKFDFPNNG